MTEEIIGIEVQGEVHAIKDQLASEKAETLEAKLSAQETSIASLETVSEEQEKKLIKTAGTLGTLLFSKLQLLQKGNGGNYVGEENQYSDFTFSIENWNSFVGVVLVHSQREQETDISIDLQGKIREVKTFLKLPDGSLVASLYSTRHGELGVVSHHSFTVDTSGNATLMQGYAPAENNDDDEYNSQSIIPVYEIYGILKDE